jgi:hypothetical protein
LKPKCKSFKRNEKTEKEKEEKEKKYMKRTRGTLSAQPRNQPAAQLPFLNWHPTLSLLPADKWASQCHIDIVFLLRPAITREITAILPGEIPLIEAIKTCPGCAYIIPAPSSMIPLY